LNKRPNVRLVETGLTFGKEGFTTIGGKVFHPSMKMTRRYYPHTYNVDGFFVSKFKKIGPTPLNAVGVNGSSSTNGQGASNTTTEYIDKAPIREDSGDESDFGDFDEEEDQKYMERAQAKTMRRKGKDPKAVMPKGQFKAAAKTDDVEVEASEDVAEPQETDVEMTKDDVVPPAANKSKDKKEKKGKKTDGDATTPATTITVEIKKVVANGVNGKEPKEKKRGTKANGDVKAPTTAAAPEVKKAAANGVNGKKQPKKSGGKKSKAQ
jgi:ribosomal RNA methyltransferase Nop2